MTAIRPERFGGGNDASADKSGPEKFAPRRTPEKLGDVERAVSAFEGEIREFVRRDGSSRQQRGDDQNDPVTENLNNLIRRVSGASMEEIDRVIAELQGVRDMLRAEGERVNREIAGYASLSHAAMTAMKVIGDSLNQWKSAPGNGSPRQPASRAE